MAKKSDAQKHSFAVINQGANAAWDGSPFILQPNDSVRMLQTPNASAVFAYTNEATGNSPATLAVTAGGGAPIFLTAPPLLNQPSILVKNWQGNSLGVTNVTPPGIEAPVLVQLISPGLPGTNPKELPNNAVPVPLAPGEAAQGTTLPTYMQLILQVKSGSLAVLVLIGGPADPSGNNAYVVALNATEETGPGTGKTPPAGYYATTVGFVYTFQFNWGATFALVVNMSATTAGGATAALRTL